MENMEQQFTEEEFRELVFKPRDFAFDSFVDLLSRAEQSGLDPQQVNHWLLLRALRYADKCGVAREMIIDAVDTAIYLNQKPKD